MEKSSSSLPEGDSSPSMTLLMRLQQLRQWQEKQRENLEKSNSSQNSISINSLYDSSISESPINIPTSVLYPGVSYSSSKEPSLANKENTPTNCNHPLSILSDSNSEARLSLNIDPNESGTNASDSSKLQPTSHFSSNAQEKDPELILTDQHKKQQINKINKKNLDSEAQMMNKEEHTEYNTENYDSTTYLTFCSSDLKKSDSSLPVKPSPEIARKVSTSLSSFDEGDLQYSISTKSNNFGSPFVDTDSNSPKILCKSRETDCISTEYQDIDHDQDHNDVSTNQNKISIKDGSNENDNEIKNSLKNHNNFDDIPIRTQSQNFQDILSKNLEGNKFFHKTQSPTVPKFSFMKKGVGSAATQIVDIDSGFGSSSSISGNATKLKTNTENNLKKSFLRKGEGTSRFGMRPSRLKKHNSNTSSYQSIPIDLKYQNFNNVNKGKLVLENIQINDGPSTDDGSKQNNMQAASFQLNEVPSRELKSSHGVNNKEKREVEELSAFERLEELADETSFCSNSSTVISLLQKGLQSASSTPIRSPAPFDFGESPIPGSNQKKCGSHHQQELLSLTEVLEHCAALVQLEKEGNSNIKQKDIDYLVESIMSDQNFSHNSFREYLQNLQRGTFDAGNPNIHLKDAQKPRVHFRQHGVDVHEFDVFDSESDTTLTDVQSIDETDVQSIDEDVTDLVTTSDLEALAHLNLHGMLEHVPDRPHVAQLQPTPVKVTDKSSVDNKRDINLNKYLLEVEGHQTKKFKDLPQNSDSVQKVLEFSPPRRPPNSASHLVWSIFGQEKQNKKSHQSNLKDVVATNERECTQVSSKPYEDDQKLAQGSDELEIDSHKTLLMAKICELEKETKTFQKKNNEVQLLQDSLKSKEENLNKEKEEFKKKMTEHESKLREAINRERNRLWKEKQDLKQLNKEQITLEAARAQSLEIMMLKEKLSDVEEEMKKKESSHQFSVRKLKDKIKSLEQENEKLKADLCTLQSLEKENLNLKHKLNKGKLESKTVLSDTAVNKTQNLKKKVTIANAIKKSVEIKQKPKSINEVNKELDKEFKTTSGEINISIKDVYPSKKLNIKDIEKITPSTSSQSILAVKEVKEIASFKRQHKNELENKPEKSSALLEAEKSCEDIASFSSPTITNLINDNSSKIKITEHEVFSESIGMSTEIFRNMQPDFHSPGSANVDYTENCRNDGTKEIIYANGNKKEILPNGVTVMNYYNGDCKEQHKDKTIYIYGTDLTKHITFTDGKEIVEFPNGQKETTYPDGSSEITFPDMSVKKIASDGTEICLMKDGTVVRTNLDGSKVFEFPGGQREIHTGDEKRREYPDGTIKILYDDGRVETRYKNGRIRIRDKQRNILTDTHG